MIVCTKNELSFSIFMLYSLADKWKMSPAKVYKIKVNRIRCRKCGDVITSESVHDFKFCKCHSCAAAAIPKIGKIYQRLRKFRRNNPFYLLA